MSTAGGDVNGVVLDISSDGLRKQQAVSLVFGVWGLPWEACCSREPSWAFCWLGLSGVALESLGEGGRKSLQLARSLVLVLYSGFSQLISPSRAL